MTKKILLTLALLLAMSPALACQSGGKTYPEGAVVGPYKCVNGQWVRR